jgi:hypothetical protein
VAEDVVGADGAAFVVDIRGFEAVLAECAAGGGGGADFCVVLFRGIRDRRSLLYGRTVFQIRCFGGALLEFWALGGDDFGLLFDLGGCEWWGLFAGGFGCDVAVFEVADYVADDDHLTFAFEDLAEDARGGGGEFHRRLVRFQLDEVFIERDGVAFAFEPAADLHFVDRLADFRNF